jgi:hypothetical protein
MPRVASPTPSARPVAAARRSASRLPAGDSRAQSGSTGP